MNHTIVVRGLYKEYNSQTILDNVNLEVEKGETLGIVGPNGIGKTTLLRIIAGIEHPTRGEVNVRGKVGLVPQDDLLLPWKTIKDNIILGLILHNTPRGIIEEKLRRVASLLELEEHLSKYPKNASGGTRRKAAISRALVMDTDILLLDEPYAGLDLKITQSLAGVLNRLKERGVTLVIVSHKLWELASNADRIIFMNGPPGRVDGEIDLRGLSEEERIARLLGEARRYTSM
ncbi:MAG: ATP-binding cassette domain-containing protein [Desulfurococcales archaeon]|nr:ATP-binding cassette domain-containing protein [Desulfurococcales archaeon]